MDRGRRSRGVSFRFITSVRSHSRSGNSSHPTMFAHSFLLDGKLWTEDMCELSTCLMYTWLPFSVSTLPKTTISAFLCPLPSSTDVLLLLISCPLAHLLLMTFDMALSLFVQCDTVTANCKGSTVFVCFVAEVSPTWETKSERAGD